MGSTAFSPSSEISIFFSFIFRSQQRILQAADAKWTR